MEKLKEKHNHTLTSILKVLTFAIVLLFPFLIFMPTAFYYGYNEHAVNETTTQINYKFQTNEVNSWNDVNETNIYHFDELNLYDDSLSYGVYVYNCEQFIYDGTDELHEYRVDNYKSNLDNHIYIYATDNYYDVYFTNYNGYAELHLKWDDYIILRNCDVVIGTGLNNFKSTQIANQFPLPTASDFNIIESITTDNTNSITQSMSNSWENMWQTPLFKWTENTPFTATTNAFASVFNISQESGFYNLIAYFITITGIYLIIDIVLGVATWLTHMIGRQD